ncbi:MAG: hypothetical protein ABL921_08900 [Pirellula sp.]
MIGTKNITWNRPCFDKSLSVVPSMLGICNRGSISTDFLFYVWLVTLVTLAPPMLGVQLHAQMPSIPPIPMEARAGTPYGVARLFIPAGQIEQTESLRILVRDAGNRVMFPAVDMITSDPPEIHSPGVGGARIGSGGLVKKIRSAIQNAREQIDPPELIRVQFLFTGSEPFQVEIVGDIQITVQVVPILSSDFQSNRLQVNDGLDAAFASKGAMAYSTSFQILLRSWWQGYIQQTTKQIERSDYPSIVESYLTHLLAFRYGFPVPDLFKTSQAAKQKQTDPLPTLALVAGVEELRAQMYQESLRRVHPQEFKLVATPMPPLWKEVVAPDTPLNLELESIAKAVPPECYYLRFASFKNYLWFQELSRTRGGDLAQMAILRGFNYETNRRMERLLNTKTTALTKLFGDSIIGDMAIIGHDLYLQEGPSLGVLFEAKNVTLLKSSLSQERTAAAKQMANIGCRLETVEIGGLPVSLLSTPDHQIRSFMVDRGQFVFLTTSQKLVERFLQVQGGEPSLGDSKAFRFARLMMPAENKYDVFVYLSSEFFRNLVSPQYQIELRRRLKAIAAIEIAEIATLAAIAEKRMKREEVTIERLIAERYLPPSFQTRADGTQSIAFNSSWHDSLRGRRGSFLPIADVQTQECTVEEARAYSDQASFYATQWQQTDPLMVGLRRFARESNEPVERLAIEAYVAPLGREKYGWLSHMLAPPVRTQIQLPPDDVINCQVHLAGQSTSRSYSPDHVMFAGLKDVVPPVPGETKGILATLRMMQSLPAYLGAWPRPGYLDRLPLGLGGPPPDAFGFSKLIVGIWRWQMGGFSVLSFDRSILENCANYLRPMPSDDFAQGRLMVGDLDKSKLSAWFNTFWFRRAAQTTRGNLMFLDAIQGQLKVAPTDALAVAETLIDAKLQCSLGGRYELEINSQGTATPNPASPNPASTRPAVPNGTTSSVGIDTQPSALWKSTAWPAQVWMMNKSNGKPTLTGLGFDATKSLPPSDYKAPWLQWFRGAKLHLTQLPERLIFVGTIDIEPVPLSANGNDDSKTPAETLPKMNLDLFNLPFQFFQGDKPKTDKESKNEPKPETRKSF